jgi:hypothetical protein
MKTRGYIWYLRGLGWLSVLVGVLFEFVVLRNR